MATVRDYRHKILRTAALGGLLSLLAWHPAMAETEDFSPGVLKENTTRIVGDMLGFVKRKTSKVLGTVEGLPATIAVLPATGLGEPVEKADISNAIHNNLGVSQFNLIKPHITERGLAVLEDRLQKPWTEIPAETIARELKTDGLLYINVDDIDQVYAAAYAHYQITVTARLHSQLRSEPVWQHTDSIIEREGGVSLNPLGIIATAVTSSRVLSDASRIQIVDQLARKFAEQIPEPVRTHKVKPPHIRLAVSNAAEGPFRAGDELRIFMEADPELSAEFFINDRLTGKLEEENPGNYQGRYIIRPGDDTADGFIEIRAFRARDRSKGYWRLPGRVAFDTRNPADLGQLSARLVRQGVRLSWVETPDRGSALQYRIERAERNATTYEEIATTAVAEYLDSTIEPHGSYFYRVTPVDGAGNQGEYSAARVTVVAPGPTDLSGVIETDRLLPAIGSPYRLTRTLRINRGSRLTFEAGSIVEIADNAGLHVLGQLQAQGTASAPVIFKGSGFRLQLDNTGATDNRFQHVRLHAPDSEILLDNARLTVESSSLRGASLVSAQHSSLVVSDSTLSDAERLLTSRGGEILLRNTRVEDSQVGIEVEPGQGQPTLSLDNGVFARNQVHIRSSIPLEVAGARFPGDTFETLRSRLEGPVTIAWDDADPDSNLQENWLKQQWGALVAEVGDKQWPEARARLNTLIATAGSEPAKVLSDSLRALAGEAPEYTTESGDFVARLTRARQAGRSPSLWIQKIRIPGNQKRLHSEVMILPRAQERFARDYLRDNFSARRRSKAYTNATRLPLREAVLASSFLHRRDRGLVSDIWVLYGIDKTVLDHHLSTAGLVERQGASLLVATAFEGDAQLPLKRELYRLLESQNIAFVDVSGFRKVDRMEQARIQQADLLLTARSLGQTNKSSLNASLNVVEVDINLRVEAVPDNRLLTSLNDASRATAFKKQTGYEKAITAVINALEMRLIREIAAYRRPEPDHTRTPSAVVALENQG